MQPYFQAGFVFLLTAIGSSTQARPPETLPAGALESVKGVNSAASRRDFATLRNVMAQDFVWSFGGDASAEQAIHEWHRSRTSWQRFERQHPAHATAWAITSSVRRMLASPIAPDSCLRPPDGASRTSSRATDLAALPRLLRADSAPSPGRLHRRANVRFGHKADGWRPACAGPQISRSDGRPDDEMAVESGRFAS